ncbi:MAG: 50S ribosomal protein L6 [Betaproteobacteria bacterium]
MSRIGKKTIAVPKGVEIRKDGNAVVVKGPKGSLTTPLVQGIDVKVENNVVQFTRPNEEKPTRAYHGLVRALVANNVIGVTTGFKKELDIVGVGYRAEVKGKQIVFALGYSHPVVFDIPAGIDVVIDKQTHITVTGVDRQLVGQVAANIRRLRKPDPYKQKGVRYTGEVLKKKAGKTGAK